MKVRIQLRGIATEGRAPAADGERSPLPSERVHLCRRVPSLCSLKGTAPHKGGRVPAGSEAPALPEPLPISLGGKLRHGGVKGAAEGAVAGFGGLWVLLASSFAVDLCFVSELGGSLACATALQISRARLQAQDPSPS